MSLGGARADTFTSYPWITTATPGGRAEIFAFAEVSTQVVFIESSKLISLRIRQLLNVCSIQRKLVVERLPANYPAMLIIRLEPRIIVPGTHWFSIAPTILHPSIGIMMKAGQLQPITDLRAIRVIFQAFLLASGLQWYKWSVDSSGKPAHFVRVVSYWT